MQEYSQPKITFTGTVPELRVVCLTGFMGSGKSTVGRLLAAQLAWRFIDLDTEIERETGSPISQIFEQKGEPVFREIEHACLSRALGWASERDARVVLSLGGGTFAQSRNAALIREFGASQQAGVAVVWLDCAIEDLLQRCVLMGDRPLFRDEASFRQLYEERLPHYQQADYRVESGVESMRVVEQILGLGIFGRSGRVSTDEAAPGQTLR